VLTESFSDGDDFNDADERHHDDTKTEVLRTTQSTMLCLALSRHRIEEDLCVVPALRFRSSGLRLRNDLYCLEWGVKLYSLTHSLTVRP